MQLAAANAEPVLKTIEINHTGNSYSEGSKMFSEGFGIRKFLEASDCGRGERLRSRQIIWFAWN